MIHGAVHGAEIVIYHLRANGDIYLAHWLVWTYFGLLALYFLAAWFGRKP